MTGPQAIQAALTSTQGMMGMYLGDLSDADLLVRPVPAANHIAWQLGHLISAEQHLAKENLPNVKLPTLPAGFGQQHGKETAAAEPPKGFLTKAQYLELFDGTRKAICTAVGELTPTDLDKPTVGNMARFAPKLGDLLMMMANHTLMHAGQFTVVRRKLGKPVVF
jgi:DinB superfamily